MQKSDQKVRNDITMDKKYRTSDGRQVRVLCVDCVGHGDYTVVALVKEKHDPLGETVLNCRKDGRFMKDGRPHAFDLVEVSPYEDWEIDDPVLVSNNGEYWLAYHFAGIDDDGSPMVWVDGRTSHSVESLDHNATVQVIYKYCKKP